MTYKPDLPSLVSSRICHDLISPVGAISNGLELLEAMMSRTPELALIADSVDSAKAKLQYFRVCFGHASAGAVIGRGEIEKTGTAMLTGPRTTIDWHLSDDSYQRASVRLVYLLLLCAETALPLGGNITVSQSGDGWMIAITAPRLKRNEAWDMLDIGAPLSEVSPAEVQFLMVAEQVIGAGKVLKVDFGETTLNLNLLA